MVSANKVTIVAPEEDPVMLTDSVELDEESRRGNQDQTSRGSRKSMYKNAKSYEMRGAGGEAQNSMRVSKAEVRLAPCK